MGEILIKKDSLVGYRHSNHRLSGRLTGCLQEHLKKKRSHSCRLFRCGLPANREGDSYRRNPSALDSLAPGQDDFPKTETAEEKKRKKGLTVNTPLLPGITRSWMTVPNNNKLPEVIGIAPRRDTG